MEEQPIGIFAEERKNLIVSTINKNSKVTVPQLCDLFNVSPATIRNDLRDLESMGLIKRTHGGAIQNKEQANFEPNSFEKEISHVNEKKEIAACALDYVRNGDTIILDTGTTIFEFSKLLKQRNNLTVVTNDLQTAFYLEREPSVSIILAGGILRKGFHCTVGARTLASLEGLHVDKAFIAANGITVSQGLTTPNIDLAKVKEFYLSMANEIFLLTDSSKFGKTSFVRFSELSAIDVMITDSKIQKDMLEELENIDINVVIAKNTQK